MTHIGCDPGKSGAIAFLPAKGEPYWILNKETLQDVSMELRVALGNDRCFAMLEIVHSTPQMGVKSAFAFGQSYGQLEALLVGVGISFERVRPLKWQQAMGCRSKGDKNVTKRKAQELFPGLKITHGNADALLLAEYARRSQLGG